MKTCKELVRPYSCFAVDPEDDNAIYLNCDNDYDKALQGKNGDDFIFYREGRWYYKDMVMFFKKWAQYLKFTPKITKYLKKDDLQCPFNVDAFTFDRDTDDVQVVEDYMEMLANMISTVFVCRTNAETDFMMDHLDDEMKF